MPRTGGCAAPTGGRGDPQADHFRAKVIYSKYLDLPDYRFRDLFLPVEGLFA